MAVSLVAITPRQSVGFVLLLAFATVRSDVRADGVQVVVEPDAAPAVRLAGSELGSYLRQLYPAARDRRVRLTANLPTPDSFAITTNQDEAVIAGGGPRGVMHGVYALLEKLGCGFYLSGDRLPPPRAAGLSFKDWPMADRPLVADRLVFNWHNFLSGCSTWNLADWQRWTARSQKMGFNAIMVHAYGNNPMVRFTFNGKTKPVGYLSTTARGRDWSTMHVNDVRRLWGGGVFPAPLFGADAAQGAEGERVEAARQLMQGVFAHASQRGMNVFFANDVDTISANPQELIRTLPEAARLVTRVQGEPFWLANPDTPEGYRYYRTQVQALLADYPQITCLVVWFRNGGTPWIDLQPAEMPAGWREEYQAALAGNPALARSWRPHSMFAIGKLVRAFERALKDLGHERIRLAAGTWNFDFLPAADRFFPPRLTVIGLDYGVLHDASQLATAEKRRALAAIGARRPLIPVIWAHHDDGHYIGRPYTPFADFHSKLVEAKADGFGIIHWTTRPLDLYFTSHARQVWGRTRNQPLRTTCDEMAARLLGEARLGGYLERWVTDAPRFARETGDRFIDRTLTDIDVLVAGCRDRAALLGAAGGDDVGYYRGLEEFIASFHRTHGQFQTAEALWKKGNLDAARTALAECRPERVIEQFARVSSTGGISRGEQGLIVSLNTRWLPHHVRLRQALGLEPIRYHFGPTSHDPLAQAPGRFTFHFTPDQQMWQTLGERETGCDPFVVSAAQRSGNEICATGIEIAKPFRLTLAPILGLDPLRQAKPPGLPAGDYRVRLLLFDPTSTAAGQRVFDVNIDTPAATAGPVRYRFEPTRARILRLVCNGNSENDWNSIVEVTSPAFAARPVVRASAAVEGHEAARAVDGRADTRWAARGEGSWLQMELQSGVALDQLAITWHEGDRRRYRVEFQVSDDGHTWRKLTPRTAAAPPAVTARVDLFTRAGGPRRVVELTYPVRLNSRGVVEVRLTPVVGKALLSAAVLEPMRTEERRQR